MEKRKVGRPKNSGEYKGFIQFRASNDMKRDVTRAARQSGEDVTAWIRGAIDDKLAGRSHEKWVSRPERFEYPA